MEVFKRILEESDKLRKKISCHKCEDITKDTFALPCDHNFCKNCIEDLNSSCSECNQPFLIQDIKEDTVSNAILRNLKTIIQIISEADKEKSEITENHVELEGYKLIIKSEVKRNPKGETPLHIACKQNNVTNLEELIRNRVDVNMKDYAGWAPLHEAVESGAYECAELLLKLGALPNIPGEFYVTPLHKAVTLNSREFIKLLLQYGADVNVIDYWGKTPIDYASNHIRTILQEPKEQIAVCHSLYVDPVPCVFWDRGKKDIPFESPLIKFASLKDLKDGNVTHFIVESGKVSNKSGPLLMTFAIVQGACIVSENWIKDFLKDQKDLLGFEHLPEQNRENIKKSVINRLKNNPRLFDGLNLFFIPSNKPHKILRADFTKEDLVIIATLGGGKVLTRQPALRTVENQFNYPYHVNKASDFVGCCNFIIYDENSPPQLLYNMKELKHRSSTWLVNCVLNFSVVC